MFLVLFSGIPAHAATNPLAKMPAKDGEVINKAILGRGAKFTVSGDSKIKLSVKSSNTKIVKVEAFSEGPVGSKKKYRAGYFVRAISPGKVKLTATAIVKGKKYTKTCIYTVYKWENPFQSIKMGKLNCKSLLQKSGRCKLKTKEISGKFSYKLKSNFTVTYITAYYYPNPKDKIMGKTVMLKNGQKLPKNTVSVTLLAKSKKNKLEDYWMKIEISN